MDLHVNNPDLQARITVGLPKPDATPTSWPRTPLLGTSRNWRKHAKCSTSRYDDLKSGRVKPISRGELVAYFREKSAAARRTQSGE